MRFTRRIGNWLDGAIGIVSPIRAYRNQLLRDELEKPRKRGYSAVRNTASNVGYWGAVGDPNSDIRADRAKVSQRVRQLVRDMPWLDEAISASVDFKVGEGFTFRPAVRNDDGSFATDLNKYIKQKFMKWCEHVEVNGRDTFGDVQRLMVRQMCEIGEAILLHDYRGGKYRLQMFEPDCIDTSVVADNIDQGVEFDIDTNEFKAFHMRSLYSTDAMASKAYRIEAGRAVFLYRVLRPWQRRGISPLVQCIFLAADLDEYMHNELAAHEMAARWLAFITDPNADIMPPTEKTRPEYLENLTIEHLPPGKSVQLAPGVARPTAGMETFKNIFLKLVATKLKVPFHLISNEYNGLNYNTLREMRNNFIHCLKPEWQYLRNHLLNEIYCRWMDFAVLSGELHLPGYYENLQNYHSVFWMAPGFESVDLLRDIKGVVAAAAAGIYDPQDWIMSTGEDPEEVMDGLAEFQRKLKEKGIETTASGTPVKDNDIGDTALEDE